MSFIKGLMGKSEIQEYVIIKDTYCKNGDFLKKGSTFIIDFIRNNDICIHFPENTTSKLNKYKEEFITIDELFKIALRHDDRQDLHEQLENTLELNMLLNEQVDDLESYLEAYELNPKREKDIGSDLYMESMLANALEKTTKERNIYKETINKMCDKFGIDHSEVFETIDDINDEGNERER